MPGSSSRNLWASERGVFWTRALEGETVAQLAPRLPAEFCEIDRDSAGVLATAIGLPDPMPVQERFLPERRCFIASVGGQIAAYGWVSQGKECIGELEIEIQIPPGEVYIWDCVTLPGYRRQGLYSALLTHMLAELSREAVRRAWIGSSESNRPSLRGFRSAGFQPVLKLVYARLANLGFLRLSRYPEAPEELFAAARRILTSGQEQPLGPFLLRYPSPPRIQTCT